MIPVAPKGTIDYYGVEGQRLLAVLDGLLTPARLAGFSFIDTPIFEATELFSRGVGESTDVVSKEMYTFLDKGDRSMTLRPEGTAGVVRAVLEHNLHRGALPLKLYYRGQMFRYERPQSGRHRQFVQAGLEALGSSAPSLDAEVIALAAEGYAGLGLRQTRLLLNSLGDAACRPAYRALLVDFLHSLDLDADTLRRVEINPLRVLDDKRPEVAAQVAAAPLIRDHLCAACAEHDAAVRSQLRVLGIPFEDAPRLVRGLDYYVRTTFEFDHPLLGAQSGIGGGGRYDGLSESIGGPPLPGIGWGLGVERTLLALTAEAVALDLPPRVSVFAGVADPRSLDLVVGVVAALRRAGIAAELDHDHPGRAVGKLIAAADKSGAAIAVFAGETEYDTGQLTVRNLRSRTQDAMAPEAVVPHVKELLS